MGAVERSFAEVMQNAFRRQVRLNRGCVVLEIVAGQKPEAVEAPIVGVVLFAMNQLFGCALFHNRCSSEAIYSEGDGAVLFEG